MGHAFTYLPWLYRWVLLVILMAGTVILMVKLSRQGQPLRNDAAPNGILSYEFAWNQNQAERMINSWKSVKQTAEQQLFLDFGFLVAYPLLFSLACAMLAESRFNQIAMVGVFISWAVLAAGPLDAIENFALLRMLDGGASEVLAQLAGWCAGVKFLLVYSSLGYIVLQGLSTLTGWMKAR